MTVAVRFDHVSKRYRLGLGRTSLREALSRAPLGPADSETLWALRDVSFALEEGHALGLIGPNGAGKTTALKLLANITRPTSGRIDIRGRISALIELGAGFHPELTGRENIYLNAAILGIPLKEAERLFDQIVDFSGLERFIETPVKRYSSGMYVRLGFSVAAHVDPVVLLVDEVLAVGDAQFRLRCAQRIEELRKKGTTIVFVSHTMPLVRSVCDSGLLLADGQVQAQGEIVAVISAYEAYLQQAQTEQPPEQVLDGQALPGASAVAIRQVRVVGTDGQEGPFLHSDAVQVRVHVVAREPVHDPRLVLRFVGADGLVGCMIRSADYGYSLDDIEGECVLALALDPLQLATGAYTVEARLVSALEGRPLARRHSPWFQVTGISTGHLRMGGVFVPRVAWVRAEAPSAGDGAAEEPPADDGTVQEDLGL